MRPTPDQLADGISRLGNARPAKPWTALHPEVWNKLQAMGLVKMSPLGIPKLTAGGKRRFNAMEAGSDVPELESYWPEED